MADADVVVIGAGAAGLSAARELSRAGLRVALVEAWSRLGGRVLTHREPGLPLPIELGAEFVHGEPPETWTLAHEAGLLVDEIPDAHWRKGRSGLARVRGFWGQMEEVTGKVPRTGRDRSFREFLERSRAIPSGRRALTRQFVSGFHAADTARISARSLSTRGEPPSQPREKRQHRIVTGYDGIVEALRAGARPERVAVSLETAVREIRWTAGRVRVRAERKGEPVELTASAAIVTVSVGVLKSASGFPGAIRFVPEIGEKRRALEKLEMGSVFRVILRFREPFWERPGFLESRLARGAAKDDIRLAFLHDPGAVFPTWWSALPARVPVLTGWAGGEAAAPLNGLRDRVIARRALASLGETLQVRPAWLERRLEGWHLHDWNADPFVRGAYSYVLVGGAGAARRLARPVASTLFFAGEATDPEQNGTVAGAIASGRRAARELLSARGG